MAWQLYVDVAPLFADLKAKLCACHVTESAERSATYYFNGDCEANYWFEFSAARRTMSPLLSTEENARLFGPATAPHGHNYRCRLTFRAEQFDRKGALVRYDEIDTCIRALRIELDHRYLNEVIGLKERPITTESLAEYIYERVKVNDASASCAFARAERFFRGSVGRQYDFSLDCRWRSTRRIDCIRPCFPTPRT